MRCCWSRYRWRSAVYLVFTVGRLALAYRGPLPGSALLASILADVALLIGLIWSFHDQYGQPAAFSLKVPTFVYLFVFIAVRVLRFDARYVLVAGVAAVLGWIGLVVAVVASSRAWRHHAVVCRASQPKPGAARRGSRQGGDTATGDGRARRWRSRGDGGCSCDAIRNEAAVADLRRFFGAGCFRHA